MNNKGLIVISLIAVFLVIVLIIFCIVSPQKSEPNNKSSTLGTVCYNGAYIDSIPSYFVDQFACLPLLQVLQKLGADIERNADYNFITFKEECYILNIEKRTLIKKDSNINLIHPAYGASVWYCENIEEDIVINIETLKVLLLDMGCREIYFVPDRDKLIINIEDKGQEGQGDGSA